MKNKRSGYKTVLNQKGQVTVLMLLVMLLCFVLTGFVIDIANAYFSHKRLQNIADMSTIAVGDQASRDSTLRSDPQKLENLLREVISRNAQMNQMPLAAGDVQINVYQNDPEKLFDIQITKGTSPLLLKAMPFSLNAQATYGFVTTPSTSPVALMFILGNDMDNGAMKSDIKVIGTNILNSLKPGDYVAAELCRDHLQQIYPYHVNVDDYMWDKTSHFLPVSANPGSTIATNIFDHDLYGFEKFSGTHNVSENTIICLNAARKQFSRFKATIPADQWNQMTKITIFLGRGDLDLLPSRYGGTYNYGNIATTWRQIDYWPNVKAGWVGAEWTKKTNAALAIQQSDYMRKDGVILHTIWYDPPHYTGEALTAWNSVDQPLIMKRMANHLIAQPSYGSMAPLYTNFPWVRYGPVAGSSGTTQYPYYSVNNGDNSALGLSLHESKDKTSSLLKRNGETINWGLINKP